MWDRFRIEFVASMPQEVDGTVDALAALTVDDGAPVSTDRPARAASRLETRSRPARRQAWSRSPSADVWHSGDVSGLGSMSSSRRRSSSVSSRSNNISNSNTGRRRRRRNDPPSSSLALRPLAPPSPSPLATAFRVTEHPPFPPLDAISTSYLADNDGYNDDDNHLAIERHLELVESVNRRQSRVATVRLDPRVTVPLGEALTDRLFGGMVEQFVFAPASKHAVVVFVTAGGCRAFLQHVQCVAANSEHEYRRLQIAAEPYRSNNSDNSNKDGTAAAAAAILPSTPGVPRAIMYGGATRVIVVSGVNKYLRKQDATAGFQQSISGIGSGSSSVGSNGPHRLVCRGRLVVPTKAYEQAGTHSNRLVVEFAGIRDAVEVRAAINAGALGSDWAGCSAVFGLDPVDRPPTAAPLPFCDCRWCRKARGEVASTRMTPASTPPAAKTASQASTPRRQ